MRSPIFRRAPTGWCADAKGFRPLETRAFPVEAYRTVRQDLKFEVAGAHPPKSWSPTRRPPWCNWKRPRSAASLAPRQIIETPTNLRSVSKNSGDSGLISAIMPLTVPGVVQVGNGAKWLTPGAGASSVKVKVDGIETTFGNFGSPDNVSQPSVEAIQEFTASVLTSRAEFGGMGTITTATKSGANQIHGGVFWYLRNSATDARNAFATVKPFQNLHNYGGHRRRRRSASDKTFFFFDFDGLKGVSRLLCSLPTCRRWRCAQGDFSAFAALKNPYTNGVNPFVGNTIAPRFLSSQALKAQNLLLPAAEFRRAHADGGQLPRVLQRAGSPPHRRDQARPQLQRAAPRLPALRKSQGRLRHPGRALGPAAHHRGHLQQ